MHKIRFDMSKGFYCCIFFLFFNIKSTNAQFHSYFNNSYDIQIHLEKLIEARKIITSGFHQKIMTEWIENEKRTDTFIETYFENTDKLVIVNSNFDSLLFRFKDNSISEIRLASNLHDGNDSIWAYTRLEIKPVAMNDSFYYQFKKYTNFNGFELDKYYFFLNDSFYCALDSNYFCKTITYLDDILSKGSFNASFFAIDLPKNAQLKTIANNNIFGLFKINYNDLPYNQKFYLYLKIKNFRLKFVRNINKKTFPFTQIVLGINQLKRLELRDGSDRIIDSSSGENSYLYYRNMNLYFYKNKMLAKNIDKLKYYKIRPNKKRKSTFKFYYL